MLKKLIQDNDFDTFKKESSSLNSKEMLKFGVFYRAGLSKNPSFFRFIYEKALRDGLKDELILTYEYNYSNCFHDVLFGGHIDNLRFIIERLSKIDSKHILLSRGNWQSSIIHSSIYNINKLLLLTNFIRSVNPDLLQHLLYIEDKSGFTPYEICIAFKLNTSLNYLIYLSEDLNNIPQLREKLCLPEELTNILVEREGFEQFRLINCSS